MKKLLTIFCAFILCIGLVGCSSKEPFEIKEACKVLDLHLLDHIILTEENYYSFTDEGLL